MPDPAAIKYRAFLSYSHADTKEAQRLHRSIEYFRIDSDLAGRATAMGPIPSAIRPVFRDRHDFETGSIFTDQTLVALDASAALVVMCSPVSAKSGAVNEEIRLFRWRHPDRPIIPIMLKGTAETKGKEFFPPALRFEIDPDGQVSSRPRVVLAADMREIGDGYDLAVAKVVARLLGVAPDDVYRRAERRRRRIQRGWITGLSAVAASLALLGLPALLVASIALAVPATAQTPVREIKIGIGGPLTTSSAGFGVEMRQAVELALDERTASGNPGGLKFVGVPVDDKADVEVGKTVAKGFCDDAAVLGVVGHVNSGVAIATGKVYADCGLAVITPMASNPKVTESGFTTIFRLTNRDDRKGPGLAAYLMQKMGKKRALVVDDGTPYGVGLADQFVSGFSSGGTIVDRKSVKVGEQNFTEFVRAWPKDIDVVFFAGIREGALILKEMRAQGLTQLFSCGDGCWDTKAFIAVAEGAATKGEGVRVLSAAPAVGSVPGSAEFAARYTAKYGPINNYAASSYDSARVLMAAIAEAAKGKSTQIGRADVVAALRNMTFQGIAYAKPVQWTAKGDNTAAVIFVNIVEGDHFKQIDQIGN